MKLRKGTILEVVVPFDSLLTKGDWGMVTREPPPEDKPKPVVYMPGTVLLMSPCKPTNGCLPLYNMGIEDYVEQGDLRIERGVEEALTEEELDARQAEIAAYTSVRRDTREETLKKFSAQFRNVSTQGRLRLRSAQQEFDAAVMGVLEEMGAMDAYGLSRYLPQTFSSYAQGLKEIRKSGQRLMESGRILPFEFNPNGHGYREYFIPSRG